MTMTNPVTIDSGDYRQVLTLGTGPMLPLTVINPYSTLAIPAYWRAVNFLAGNLASFGRSVRRDGARLDQPHALDVLLKRKPNALQNAFTFWRTLFFHAVHAGNGYARIDRAPNSFTPVALTNMLPEDVRPIRVDRGDGRGMQQWYGHLPSKTAIPALDVVHLQALSHDGMCAIDPIMLHETTFQSAATLTRYKLQFLRKGTVVRGAVEVPGQMTDLQMAQMRAVLRNFCGGETDDDVLILSDSAKLNNATLTPRDSQLAEQSAASTKTISQITGVPPEFLYELGEAKYNASVEQAGQNVVRYTFRPWIELAEAELTLKLISDAEQADGYGVTINPDALLRGSTKEQVDVVVAEVNAGVASKNEGREYLGLPKSDDPDADKLKTLGDTAPPDGQATADEQSTGDNASASSGAKPLTGYHVSSAMRVLRRLQAGKIGGVAARKLLVGVGLSPEAADEMAAEASKSAA